MPATDYWLDDLVDENHISSLADARAFVADPKKLASVVERYSDWAQPLEPLPSHAGETIVAGSVLDLSGELDCTHPECLMRRVDELFTHVWHYFDTVVVTGATSRDLSENYDADPESLQEYLLAHIETLLYMRKIGARDQLVFREKPHWCLKHLPKVAERLGVERFNDLREEFVDRSLTVGLLAREPYFDGARWNCVVKQPWDGNMQLLGLNLPQDASREEIARAAAQANFHSITDLLAGDVMRADVYGAPLAVHNSLHNDWVPQPRSVSSDVALSLELPILRDASPQDIALIRKEEAASFAAFRTALRKAINERVEAAGESSDPSTIAKQIDQDLIAPAVNDIERSLEVARRTMLRKSATRIGLATVGVTAGLLTGFPLMIASGLGLVISATSLPPLDAYIEKKQEIELRDMYFLWKAQRRLPRT